jgi:hypothetical protein
VEINVLISLASMIGAGFSAYVGVRVGLAEVRGDIKRLDKDVEDLDGRTRRLEEPYFKMRGGAL